MVLRARGPTSQYGGVDVGTFVLPAERPLSRRKGGERGASLGASRVLREPHELRRLMSC
jgi:hypothetical protein